MLDSERVADTEEKENESNNEIAEEDVQSSDNQASEEATPGTSEPTDQDNSGQGDTNQSDNKGDGKSDQEYVKHVQNWRALREKAEKAERERDEVLARFQQQQPSQPQPEQDLSLKEDDLAEGKHLKYYQKKNEDRIAQLETQLLENQLKANFPDFEKVVTPDTLGMLKDTDPELTESLAYNPNLYTKAVAAYKAIKRYGLAGPSYDREKEKIKKNAAKPRTVSSISPHQGASPLSRANEFADKFSEKDQEEEWRRMQDIINNS